MGAKIDLAKLLVAVAVCVLTALPAAAQKKVSTDDGLISLMLPKGWVISPEPGRALTLIPEPGTLLQTIMSCAVSIQPIPLDVGQTQETINARMASRKADEVFPPKPGRAIAKYTTSTIIDGIVLTEVEVKQPDLEMRLRGGAVVQSGAARMFSVVCTFASPSSFTNPDTAKDLRAALTKGMPDVEVILGSLKVNR